ncbi:MAG: fumarate hydratase [SAR324 cluster bacterium]|nr:fumarate hydratase [SAR324 cluster bacterium]
MRPFYYQEPLPMEKDATEYKQISTDHVSIIQAGNRIVLQIQPEGLSLLAEKAMYDVSHLLRSAHLKKLETIINDPEASDNDVFVATSLLENAIIAAEMVFPSCQDTGTAIVMGKKGEQVWTGGNDADALSHGIYKTYQEDNLRFSQVAPQNMFDEKNTGTNLPAQIDLYATQGMEYHFLFMAKGGGSANKTYLYQETKALLNPASLEKFVMEKLKTLGTAACPPYHLAFVIGGTSAETTLKTLKLATTGYLDKLPTTGNEHGRAFRDLEWEEKIFKITQKMGIGAQFGGKYFCHDVRVIRLPRHGASCPVAMGVSCSADRNIKAKITREGLFIEKLETNPAQFLPVASKTRAEQKVVTINLDEGMDAVRKILSQHPIKTRVMLNGKIVVARDIAHAKLKELLDQGKGLPEYLKQHIIYYAGPAKTPEGYASGSFGPTTAQRMDPYVPIFQKEGASLVMLAKGNRTAVVREACKQYGGFYLGSIGGPAAVLGKNCITDIKILEFEELGMEAIFQITVKDFPAFIITDDKGNDFFSA